MNEIACSTSTSLKLDRCYENDHKPHGFYEWTEFAHKRSIGMRCADAAVVAAVFFIDSTTWSWASGVIDTHARIIGVAVCIIKNRKDITFLNNLFYENHLLKASFWNEKQFNHFIYIIDKIKRVYVFQLEN